MAGLCLVVIYSDHHPSRSSTCESRTGCDPDKETTTSRERGVPCLAQTPRPLGRIGLKSPSMEYTLVVVLLLLGSQV
jgi:hypothetical protein